jgi:hypothetical protein
MPAPTIDFDARICYLVVAAGGLLTAFRQLGNLLKGIPRKWRIANTWLLLIAYFAVPVVLFFALDLTGAIVDTSLIAAVGISFTYDRILAGAGSVEAPSALTSWWPSFKAWATKVTEEVASRDVLQEQRLIDRIVADVNTPEKLADLADLAMTHEDDPQALNTQLEEIDVLGAAAALSENTVRERKVRLIHKHVSAYDDFLRRLLDREILDEKTYNRNKQGTGKGLMVLVVLVFVVLALGTWLCATSRPVEPRYYAWRLTKPGTSVLDQHRALEHLDVYLDGEETGQRVALELARRLRRPDLKIERANQLLSLLVRAREGDQVDAGVWQEMGRSLRTVQIDVRSRIHTALLSIAEDRGLAVADELKEWEPSQGDSTLEIEDRVAGWQQVFAASAPTNGAPRSAG